MERITESEVFTVMSTLAPKHPIKLDSLLARVCVGQVIGVLEHKTTQYHKEVADAS